MMRAHWSEHDWWRIAPVATAIIGASITFGPQPVRGASEAPAAQVARDSNGKIAMWTGVYTEEQAKRGNARYQRLCLSCHHGELQGDRDIGAPPLSGGAFLETW